MRGKAYSARLAAMVFLCCACVQTAAVAEPYGSFDSLRPAGTTVALRLSIPFGGGQGRSKPMLALTAGPEWRQWTGTRYASGGFHSAHTITAGLSFDGSPVLALGGFDLSTVGIPLLHANETEAGGDGEVRGALLGAAALGGLLVVAMLGGGSGGGHDLGDAWSGAISNLGENIAQNCPAFPLEPCPDPAED